jgi:hypothetical protein
MLIVGRPIDRDMTHVVCIITASFSATFAFAFLVAGLVALIQFDDQEVAAVRRDLADARKHGWLQRELRTLRWMHCEFITGPRLLEHWRTRRETRWLICLGILCLALAATAGYFAGAFE